MFDEQKIPRWIIGYAILQLALALLFGVLAYLNRGFQFPELVGNVDATFAIGLFANRNLGVAITFIVALILYFSQGATQLARPMLLTLFLVRFATDLFDFLLAILGVGVEGVGPLIGQLVFFALILWIPELLAIRTLWGK
ncbi:MAG: hypothetical protein AAF614_00755 [Chloroflexota bacterium]